MSPCDADVEAVDEVVWVVVDVNVEDDDDNDVDVLVVGVEDWWLEVIGASGNSNSSVEGGLNSGSTICDALPREPNDEMRPPDACRIR